MPLYRITFDRKTPSQVERICTQCRTIFFTNLSVIKKGGGKYCSTGCYNNSKKKPVKRICRQCGHPFKATPCVTKKFCSYQCKSESQRKPVMENFLSKIIKTDTCWLWTGTIAKDGYGQIGINGRSIRVHRFSFELFKGPIPEGMQVLHKCDNPPCVNPEHLFLGTSQDNVNDCVQKKRHVHGERNSGAKLKNADVIKIRQDSRTKKEIAKSYHISPYTVGRIKNRHSWKYV